MAAAVPSGVVASAERIYVSNGNNDSISVINAATLQLEKEIEIRIPELEKYRGVLPIGLALSGNRLLVAEAGINAIGVIDTDDESVAGASARSVVSNAYCRARQSGLCVERQGPRHRSERRF